MKLTRENIYINLQGKNMKERSRIANYLLSINEKCESSICAKIQRSNTLEFYKNEWFTDYGAGDKQEVTIQQLKEILQPMENTKFKKDDVIIITDFGRITSNAYTQNFTLNKPYILEEDFNKENGLCVKIDDNNNKRNGWSKAFDLGIKIELYKEPTLTEKLEKAEAEVKRLKEAIEDSKIKVDDWITFNNGSTKGVDKVISINSSNYNILTQFCCYKESECKKITDQELINKLNELIK